MKKLASIAAEVPHVEGSLQHYIHWTTTSYKMVKAWVGKNPLNQVHPGINLSCPGLIGDPKPEVLLIGDEKNNNLKHLPVFCSSSGMFLMKALNEVVGQKKVAIVNSVHHGKTLTWKQVYRLLPKTVVFLGNKSFERLGPELNAICYCLPHPQFAKRFYGKDALVKYTAQLKEKTNAL